MELIFKRLLFIPLLLFYLEGQSQGNQQPPFIVDRVSKTIKISSPDKKILLIVDYKKGCVIKSLFVNGVNTLSSSGAYTGIRTKDGDSKFSDAASKLSILESPGRLTIKGIKYQVGVGQFDEVWDFTVKNKSIIWDITRFNMQNLIAEDMSFPRWHFKDLSVWKAGILNNGGMVWCKYLKNANDTYGVHTGGVTFYNDKTGDGLFILGTPDKEHTIASKFSNTADEFTFTQIVSSVPVGQRYNLSRFVSKKANVFSPVQLEKGKTTARIELKYVDYFQQYSRGTLPGIDAESVRELLNTTARYGVVDNNLVGGNGWLTNWKVTHEPFFAQIGMAIGDKNYINNMSATLDQERDQAMLADGRVLSRWHNAAGDEIKGTYNSKTGYYEAQWGYMIDSQTGYVINTAEQFDLNGSISWLRSHQSSCEKALDWLIKRDKNNNGLYEMINSSISEKKASDWLDIVWASYENSFVNAQMYEALTLWARCEKILGSDEKSQYYLEKAKKLKETFNKPVEEGGFWSSSKKQYIYWRDKDGSVHGDNLITPINFAAIAYNICDDPQRIKLVLDQIEERNEKEHLFHWPLCYDSFKRDEVQSGNWPFPKYENGDIFPTWGCIGIRAYAKYDKNIALKFVVNLLDQYKKDGLSSQRYSRVTQLGQGDDVLSGICTSITALYRDIYGIRPKFNRMGLEPNLTDGLNGTHFTYTLRDTPYDITLSQHNYQMQTKAFSVKCNSSFGASGQAGKLVFYPSNQDDQAVTITGKTKRSIALSVDGTNKDALAYTIKTPNNYTVEFKGLRPATKYELSINGKKRVVSSTGKGIVIFDAVCTGSLKYSVRVKS
ncbi:MAG TPA: hypothetical protein DIT07_14805 [Sphingobacteriaceae bacterium]|nr:hypothetical protein [Sphingobacteriaceae bacterium]